MHVLQRIQIELVRVTLKMFLAIALASSAATVTNCTETDLRRALSAGGTVTFACDGTISLTHTITNIADTVLDGAGRQVTISGNGASPAGIFYVVSNRLTLANLTLADGSSTYGGAIYSDHGTVCLINTTLQDNHAASEFWNPPLEVGRGGNGGAILNSGGTVTATNCFFIGNHAGQSGGGSVEWMVPSTPCLGGAIDNEGGQLLVQNCVFRENSVSGGSGWTMLYNGIAVGSTGGRHGCGGAIYNSGTLVAGNCTFEGNSGWGGNGQPQPDPGYAYSSPIGLSGAPGGNAQGGAICNTGSATITGSSFFGNSATGGSGSTGGPGQSYWSGQGWEVCGDGGVGGQGGDGMGGAVFDGGNASLINCTLASNFAQGGLGGNGGRGGFVNVRYACAGSGGAGGRGGTGISAIYCANGGLRLTNCTIAFHNSSAGGGGAGGPAGGADPVGGATGLPGAAGMPGEGVNAGSLVNTLFASNFPVNGSAMLTDGGNNLSSDSSCAFTAGGSLNNQNPLIGNLAANGGPALTIALLPGSPAIDSAAAVPALTTDERGFPRQVGAAPDIGAYEFGSPAALVLSPRQSGGVDLLAIGVPNQQFRLQTSTNLVDWKAVTTNRFPASGYWSFRDGLGAKRRFYRLRLF